MPNNQTNEGNVTMVVVHFSPTASGRSGFLDVSIRLPYPLPHNCTSVLLTEYNKIRAQYGVEKFEFTVTANVIVSKTSSTTGFTTYDLFFGMGYGGLAEDAADPNAGAHVPCHGVGLHEIWTVKSADDVADLPIEAVTDESIAECFESVFSDLGSNVLVAEVANVVCLLRTYVEGREADLPRGGVLGAGRRAVIRQLL